MRAIQVLVTGGPGVLTLAEVPVPKPKLNEALVKISTAGVNFVDVYFREGRYPAPLPFIAGQEAAGVVTEVGTAVTSLKPGDHVVYTGIRGAYAEYACVPADRLIQIPSGISDRDACAAMLQGITAHYLLTSTYPLRAGETALIHAAAGGVGLLMVQMAKSIGARVIATVGSDEKVQLVKAHSADEVINYAQVDFETETKRLTGDQGVHVVYDGVGRLTFSKGLNVLRRRGYMVLFGGASGPVPPLELTVLSEKGSLFVTRPSSAHYIATRQELEHHAGAVLTALGQGKLKLRIHNAYPLQEAEQAHRDLESRKTSGKLLLIP